jgi:hypothetical protein
MLGPITGTAHERNSRTPEREPNDSPNERLFRRRSGEAVILAVRIRLARSTLRLMERLLADTQRRQWVRGDVHCLMCSRLIGRLLGSQGPIHQRQIGPLTFFAYKAAESTSLVEAYTPDRQFQCPACGGSGVLDDVEFLNAEGPAAPSKVSLINAA